MGVQLTLTRGQVRGRQQPEAVWHMEKIFARLKHLLRRPFIADLPPELAQCEDGCRVGECSQGKWISCENRIRRMREENRAARIVDAESTRIRATRNSHEP